MMLMSDIQIRDAVLRGIRWDPCISVAVSGGIVTLSGMVDSPMRSLEAHEAAQMAEGVFRVIDEIEVGRPTPPELTSEEVTRAIEAALKERAQLEAQRIRVSLKDGLVTLSGLVQSREEGRAVLNAASLTPGVRGINDQLKLES